MRTFSIHAPFLRQGGIFLALFVFLLPTAGFAQYTPASWPATFIDYTDSTGGYIQDISDMTPTETDVIFSTSTPSSVMVDHDGTTAFFRFQLLSNPYKANGQWAQYAWVVAIGDSTGQGEPIGWVSVNVGNNMTVEIKDKTTSDVIYTYAKTLANPGAVRSLPAGSSGFFYLDFQVPMAAITSRTGITMSSHVRFFYGTSASSGTINKDYMTGSAVSFLGLATTTFTDISNGTLISLPVELSSFSAFLKGSTAQLRWKTATELNNYGFEVQRSVNDGEWTSRGFVQGAGTVNAPRSYSWEDDIASIEGVIRYRLRQIDRDGSEEMHATVELHTQSVAAYGIGALYPQPARDNATVSYRVSDAGSASLGLYDFSGRLVRAISQTNEAGGVTRSAMLDLGDLPPGSYLLRLQENAKTHQKILLIAR